MSRLVLDTNCLIQIVSPRSKYHSLWDSFVIKKGAMLSTAPYRLIFLWFCFYNQIFYSHF